MIMKKYSGFTLIEIMVMLAVMAIVMTVGMPQLSIFFKGNRMVTNTNDLIGGLHVARSSAIKEAGRVTMCKSSNAADPSPTCSTGTEGWEEGWFVYVEGTDPANIIGTYNSSDGDILRVNTGAEGGETTITTTGYSDIENFVSFSSRGLPTKANGNSVSGVFMVCDDRGLKNAAGNVVANGVVLLASGRVGASKTESKIGVCP
jgi:type IV fimbrial biogenesis protein FimT